MNYEKSKAPLALMEQIIMILVFAVAAAVCLQAYVYSDNLSKRGALRDSAVTRVQKMVEFCKEEHGDLEKVSRIFPAAMEEDKLYVRYPEDGMTLSLQVTESDEYIEKALVRALDEKGGEIYSVEAAWQKGGAG